MSRPPVSARPAGRGLRGRTIALPETRELEKLGELLEAEGAATLRCPLVSIHDVADAAPVTAWLARFVGTDPPDDLIDVASMDLEVVVGEVTPLLLDLTADAVPRSLELLRIHH